jgi:aspartyl-tRNA synthetase
VGEQLDLIEQDAFQASAGSSTSRSTNGTRTNKKVDFAHNPFSMPQGGLEALKTRIR